MEYGLYEQLKQPTPPDELLRLARRIETHLDRIEEAGLRNEFVQTELASSIVRSLDKLIDEVASLDADQRAAVRGCIEYFIQTADIDDDVMSPIGLEDDARVFNRMCEEIGRLDLTVTLE